MRFGRTLRQSIHKPWATHYIDYDKLKKLLREPGGDSDEEKWNDGTSKSGKDPWTDDDEAAFVEELVNVQLDKVYSFQVEKWKELQERAAGCQSTLDEWVQSKNNDDDPEKRLRSVNDELDDITREVNELEKFSRINFTGFIKAAKKHDRKRGKAYRVTPLVQVRLGALPFNSEDYSPLLCRFDVPLPHRARTCLFDAPAKYVSRSYRLSDMYSFVRQHLENIRGRSMSSSDVTPDGAKLQSYKCELCFFLPK